MRTEQEYSDYILEFDWRWTEQPGNSGLLMHISGPDEVWPKSIESQLHAGDAGDIWVIGGTTFAEHVNKDDRRTPKKEASNEKPVGEWNHKKVICKGDTIEIWVNGVLQNKATGASVQKGYIGLQSEGAPIEFRKIVLKPIK